MLVNRYIKLNICNCIFAITAATALQVSFLVIKTKLYSCQCYLTANATAGKLPWHIAVAIAASQAAFYSVVNVTAEAGFMSSVTHPDGDWCLG